MTYWEEWAARGHSYATAHISLLGDKPADVRCPTQRRKLRALKHRPRECDECGATFEFGGHVERTYAVCPSCVAALSAAARAEDAYLYGDFDIDEVGFADPGGRSALRAATGGGSLCPSCECKTGAHDRFCRCCGVQLNPRDLPCPTCGRPNQLTDLDRQRGYQCDYCADERERGF